MSYGLSILLLAAGAVLTWAVDVTVEGLDLRAVGVILMVVGCLGLIFSLLYWSVYADRRRTETVVEREVAL
ncbi:MAG: DUF6458 family protein [Acidimicrobiales bacterium]|nr:DUF6458 family protein [Acidimicrobiales bacterium]